MGEGGQKTQTSSFTSKFWGCNVEPGDCREQYCIVYLEVSKRIDFKVLIRKPL